MRGRLAATAAVLVSAAVLLTACGSNAVTGGACNVSVSTAALVHQRQQAGIADCTASTLAVDVGAPAARLPDTALGCLGSKQRTRLTDIKGPALVNFWASTCDSCRKEMPVLAAFAEKYAGQVSVVGVDYLETYPGAALDLAQQSGVTYPLMADPCGDLQQSSLLQPQGLPYTYFVDAHGSVSKPVVGGLDSVAEVAHLAAEHGITLKAAG
jgi:thiol-disulfide isomerase/thioredoxin